MIIINDMQTAFDLLDKKSSIYSSRPRIVFGGEMYVDSVGVFIAILTILHQGLGSAL